MSKNVIQMEIPIFIFSIIIGLFGATQILNAASMSQNIPGFLPAVKILTYVSGVALLLAAVSFIIDRMARLAGYLLALLLLIIVFSVDVPGIIHAHSLAAKSLFTTNALKDTAIAMAAIIIGNLSKH